ncbi:hypothetical protein MKK65_29640 [Methylobacterium sp. J-001]|uniref:hypothetical protein n=1 Tax=Methylobacterium sp. J-001 TaxID=2836609 RepID=UPI001FB93D6D|nr:hypothetical protein [Methylobacterium sp. J-001]MCJ2120671.1 hypothetical protein [Methylobacterium sp. J-001]
MSMTVAEMAERIAGSSDGVPAGTIARQIRNWAQAGLFGDLTLRGTGPTAAQIFEDEHLVTARLFNILGRLGMNVAHFEVVKRLLNNAPLTEYPVGRAYRRGLPFVLEQFRAGQTDWRLLLYTDTEGAIQAGGFDRDAQPHPLVEQTGPIVISIRFAAICSRLFPSAEEASA